MTECATQENADTRSCSCYPGEGPLPCPRKFALRDCWRAAVLDETQQNLVAFKNRDRTASEERLLHYFKRVRCALELETSDFPDVGREPRELHSR
jgi:hypothetical protein